MNMFTPLRIERVEALLAVEPAFSAEMSGEKVELRKRSGDRGQYSSFTIRVCRALAERGIDGAKCPKFDLLGMASKIKSGEVEASAEPPTATAPPPPLRKSNKPSRPANHMKQSVDIMIEQARVLQEGIGARRQQQASIVLELEKLENELVMARLAIRVLKGEVEVTSPGAAAEPQVAAGPRKLRLPRLPLEQYRIAKSVTERRVRTILMGVLETKCLRTAAFFKVWNSRQGAIYVRAFAQELPPGAPFMTDMIHVSPKATPETVAILTEAICSVPLPNNFGRMLAEDVRDHAREVLAALKPTFLEV